jgi:histidine ammonia-lyase
MTVRTTSVDDPGRNALVSARVRRLLIADFVRVAHDRHRVAGLDAEVVARVQATSSWVAPRVEQIADDAQGSPKPVAYYGINTGFGARAGRSALGSPALIELLGCNLLANHSVGVGPYFDEAVVRAALLRAQSLAQSNSKLTEDRVLYPDIRKAVRLLRAGTLVRAAREATREESSC